MKNIRRREELGRLAVTEAGSKLLWKSTDETRKKEKILQVFQKISVDASVETDFSELVGILTIKEEQRAILKVLLSRKRVFVLLPTPFGESLV